MWGTHSRYGRCVGRARRPGQPPTGWRCRHDAAHLGGRRSVYREERRGRSDWCLPPSTTPIRVPDGIARRTMRRCRWPPGRCGFVLPVGRGASPPRPTGPGAPPTDRGSEDGGGAPGWDQARECPVPQPGRGCSPCGGHAANAPSDARHTRAGGGKSGRTLPFRVAVMAIKNPWSSVPIRDSFEQSFEHIYSKPRVRQDRNDGHTTRQDLSRSRQKRRAAGRSTTGKKRSNADAVDIDHPRQGPRQASGTMTQKRSSAPAGHSRLRPES